MARLTNVDRKELRSILAKLEQSKVASGQAMTTRAVVAPLEAAIDALAMYLTHR